MVKNVRLVLVAVMFCFAADPAFAQLARYNVSWQNPNSHYFDVEMTFQNPEPGSVSVRIPSWRPGRYVIQNFVSDIVGFVAADGSGNPLRFQKTDKATWAIDAAPGQEVKVTYRAYSRKLDAGSSYLDETEAYINPVTLLMYIPGRELEPVVLSIEKPEGWRTATALNHSAQMGGYWAADYHELVDSPFIISPTLEILSFEHGGSTFEIAIQGEADYDPDAFIADVRKIVETQTGIMGVIPFDRYVFLYHFLTTPFGHGVEHKNSTSIVIGPVDFDNPSFYRSLLGVTSHEFWHVWLVERIRPEAIYHPDYSVEAYTTTMWIYEGFATYYGNLTLRRADLIGVEAYENQLAAAIRSFEENPAREVTSVAMTSWDSWTKFDDPPPYSYYSFYTAGHVLGLLLDMEVRGRTRNRQSLDDVMRYLYQTYAADDRGVPESGFREALETITSGTFQPFFDDHVYGTEPIDYDRYLYYAGYRLERAIDESKPAVRLGIEIAPEDGEMEGSMRIRNVRPGGGAFEAGLDVDDVVIALDGRKVTRDNLSDLYESYSPGDSVSVTVFRDDRLETFEAVLMGGGNIKYELVRLDDPNLLQNQTRRDWLGLAAG